MVDDFRVWQLLLPSPDGIPSRGIILRQGQEKLDAAKNRQQVASYPGAVGRHPLKPHLSQVHSINDALRQDDGGMPPRLRYLREALLRVDLPIM